jgi:hypothetical protein
MISAFEIHHIPFFEEKSKSNNCGSQLFPKP